MYTVKNTSMDYINMNQISKDIILVNFKMYFSSYFVYIKNKCFFFTTLNYVGLLIVYIIYNKYYHIIIRAVY